MKTILMSSVLLLFAHLTYAQTEALEVEYLNQRFQNKEFSLEKFREYGKTWAKLLDSFGGYPELPYDGTHKRVRYLGKYEFSDVDKITIYKRLKEWAALNAQSEGTYILHEDYETGRLMVRTRIPSINFKRDQKGLLGVKSETKDESEGEGIVIFTFANNRLKIELAEIEYTYKFVKYEVEYGSSSLTGGFFYTEKNAYAVEVKLNEQYPITKANEIFWKQRLSFLEETKGVFERIANDVLVYVKDYKNDWDASK